MYGMSFLVSGGRFGGCRYVTSGLGDMPLATGEGATAQDTSLLCALTWTCICRERTVEQSVGVFKRLFLCPAKWTGTVLAGLICPVERDGEGARKCCVMQL